MSGRWASSTRRSRLPADWPRTRARVLRRDSFICHVCGQPGANDVDHVRAGDDHGEHNLAAIHRFPCHARKSSAEGGRAAQARGAARRAARKRPSEPHPGLTP